MDKEKRVEELELAAERTHSGIDADEVDREGLSLGAGRATRRKPPRASRSLIFGKRRSEPDKLDEQGEIPRSATSTSMENGRSRMSMRMPRVVSRNGTEEGKVDAKRTKGQEAEDKKTLREAKAEEAKARGERKRVDKMRPAAEVVLRAGDMDVFREMLAGESALAHLVVGQAGGRTPLHFAAERDDGALAEALLDCHGVDVNAEAVDGVTPLYAAAAAGSVAVACALLRFRAKWGAEEVVRRCSAGLAGGRVGIADGGVKEEVLVVSVDEEEDEDENEMGDEGCAERHNDLNSSAPFQSRRGSLIIRSNRGSVRATTLGPEKTGDDEEKRRALAAITAKDNYDELVPESSVALSAGGKGIAKEVRTKSTSKPATRSMSLLGTKRSSRRSMAKEAKAAEKVESKQKKIEVEEIAHSIAQINAKPNVGKKETRKEMKMRKRASKKGINLSSLGESSEGEGNTDEKSLSMSGSGSGDGAEDAEDPSASTIITGAAEEGTTNDAFPGVEKSRKKWAIEAARRRAVGTNTAELDLDVVDCDGESPLWRASCQGNLEIVQALLARGANAFLQCKSGTTPLWAAAFNGHVGAIECLLPVYRTAQNSWSVIHSPHADGRSPLWVAARRGHEEVVRGLLRLNAEVDCCRPSDKATPLFAAAFHGHAKVAELLCSSRADLNARNETNESTPLWAAVQNGHQEVVDMLCYYRADVNARCANGCTPLIMAARGGHKDIAERLLMSSASVNEVDNNGDGPLAVAAEYGNVAMVQMLVRQYRASPSPTNKAGFSPLALAAQNAHPAAARMLCVHGANVDAANEAGMTALSLATQENAIHVVRILLSYGADANVRRSSDGATAIWIAARNGNAKAVSMLAANGAWVDSPLQNGSTALVASLAGGHIQASKILLRYGASTKIKPKGAPTPIRAARRASDNSTELKELVKRKPPLITAKELEQAKIRQSRDHYRGVVPAK